MYPMIALQVYIKEEFMGGCDDIKKLQHDDELVDKVSDLMRNQKVVGRLGGIGSRPSVRCRVTVATLSGPCSGFQ